MDDATLPAAPPSAGGDLAEGVMIGRYRLITKLGAGAMGVVWSADDPQLERRIAIKVVHPSLARAPEASDRLLREARAMAKLSHRSVVTVHDAGEVDGRLFLAMELVTGTTLGQMLRARSPAQAADWQRWLIMMIDAGQGLAAAHAKGVLHRDFKPDNVLVDAAGRVAVADFGLATLGAGDSGRMHVGPLDLTTTGALVGTPMYMSAEALAGRALDARADQFSFCVALFEALYDRKPFPVAGQSLDAIAELSGAIERGDIADPPAGTHVPARVHAAIVRGLAHRPDARWPSLPELLAELARGAGMSTLRDSGVAVPPPARRRHVPWIIAGLAVIAAAIALVFLLRGGSAPLAPKLLFGVATHTAIAVSPTGDRIAVGADGLEVHDLATGKIWSIDQPGEEVSYLEVDDREVRFSTPVTHAGESRWAYAGDNAITRGASSNGVWFGKTAAGDLYALDHHELRVVDASGRRVRARKVPMKLEVVVPSPDHRRVAFIQAGRFNGTVVVWDLDTDTAIESPRFAAPTSLDWLDDTALVMGTGVNSDPALSRLPITPGGFGPRETIYTQRRGWFGYVKARRGARPAIFAIDMRPNARTRMIEKTDGGQTVHDFDTATTTVGLGWLDNHQFLTWARDTGGVEIRDGEHRIARTKIVLPGEPANATSAGRTLIASVRTVDGREAVAWDLDADKPRWIDPNLVAVRCAGDRQAPCYALIALDDGEQIVAIDPATGALGKDILYTGTIEDISVELDGKMLHVADRKRGLTNIDADGKVLGEMQIGNTPWARSLACGMDGRLLVGGTAYKNVYRVGEVVNGQLVPLTETENDILSLVRPSDDGKRVLFLARTFAPEVIELEE